MTSYKKNYQFYSNVACEFYPCHIFNNGEEEFNCLFCYCPLYALGDRCEGDFVYTEEGIKDCSGCTIPHSAEGYQHIMDRIHLLTSIASRPQNSQK